MIFKSNYGNLYDNLLILVWYVLEFKILFIEFWYYVYCVMIRISWIVEYILYDIYVIILILNKVIDIFYNCKIEIK